jgi:hypothetical protein
MCVHICTYWYILVHTFEKTCGFLIHPGSVLRIKCNSVQLLCKGCYIMMPKFKKCKVQVILVHTSILVRTDTNIIRKLASFESRSILFPTPTSLHCTLDLFLWHSVLSRPSSGQSPQLSDHHGFPRLNKQVQQSMYQYVLVCNGMYWYITVCTGMECTNWALVHPVRGCTLPSAVHIDVHTSTYQYEQVHTVFIAVVTEMCHFNTSYCSNY